MKSIELNAIDLNLLVAFEALLATESVTTAAQQIHLGQPAMSAALKRLRRLFNDALFVRVGREMKPTAKALEIAPGITAALQQIRQTLQASQTFDPATTQQTFTIGSSDYASTVIVPSLLNHCHQAAPGINLRLIGYEKTQVATLLEQPTLTMVLGSTFRDLPAVLIQQPLMTERFVGIGRPGHSAIQAGAIALTDFAQLPHALFTLRQDDVGVIDQALARQHLQRRIVVTTPYLLTLPDLIAGNEIIAAVPSRLAQQFAQQGLVDVFELPLAMPTWSITMVWSPLSDQAPGCQWLRGVIEEICRNL